jgi:hypothetical protein
MCLRKHMNQRGELRKRANQHKMTCAGNST